MQINLQYFVLSFILSKINKKYIYTTYIYSIKHYLCDFGVSSFGDPLVTLW